MKFRSAFAVLSMTVALTACGQLPFQRSEEAQTPAHSGPPVVSPLDQPIETGAEGTAIATAEARTMNTAMFRAMGSGWTVTAADKTAVYERPGAKSTGVSVRRMTYARGVEFVGVMNGQVFSLNLQAQECDTGAGKAPFSAKLRVGSQRLTGCAAPTDTMPKAQVKASSASPKPKTVPRASAPAARPAAEKATATEAGTTPAATVATTPAPATPAPAATTPAAAASEPGTTSPTPAAETPSATTTPAPAEPAAVPTPAAPGTDAATPSAPATPPVVPAAPDAPQQ